MRKSFDRRVVPDFVLGFVRACQTRVVCHLGGGAALAGAYLGHRMTGDVDLFVHDAEEMRVLVGLLPSVAAEAGIGVTLLRDVVGRFPGSIGGEIAPQHGRVGRGGWEGRPHRPAGAKTEKPGRNVPKLRRGHSKLERTLCKLKYSAAKLETALPKLKYAAAKLRLPLSKLKYTAPKLRRALPKLKYGLAKQFWQVPKLR